MGWISMSERDLKRIEVLSEVRSRATHGGFCSGGVGGQ